MDSIFTGTDAAASTGAALTAVPPLSTTARLDAKLEHLDRLASLGSVSAAMAHEIKNALVATETLIQLLLERHPDAELAPVARRELGRIDRIVKQMLKLSKPQADGLSRLNIHDLLQGTLLLVKPRMDEKALLLELSLQATDPWLLGSQCKLQQVILNLLLNAVEASPQHGCVRVATENATDALGTLRFRVGDDGPGIRAEHIDRLFTPFFTTKPCGTGLGLAITRHILEEHQAQISLVSKAGQGARFLVSFPSCIQP